MMGVPDDEGLTPRLCRNLFDRIHDLQESGGNGYKIAVETSYYEIYNEKVFDLLAKQEKGKEQKALTVRNSPAIGPYVKGLKTFAVESFEMVEALINQGLDCRHVSATAMNAGSSRSHAVFMLKITQTLDDGSGGNSEDMEKSSQLNLVDLAGSERQTKTKATGSKLKEGANINKSLSTLGQVINGLVKASAHVPYRDSSLTFLLKESFGGNAKTVMMATLSPSADNFDETLSTLRYADNAKQIKNKAVINEGASAKIIRELNEQIAKLIAEGGGGGEGVSAAELEDQKEQLAAAQALLQETSLSHEAKLERTRAEMEERVKIAEQKAHAAVIQAERHRDKANTKALEFMGLKWKATAHIHAVERKLSESMASNAGGGGGPAGGDGGGGSSNVELEQKLAMERLKAKQLEEQLEALQLQHHGANSMQSALAVNKQEIALLKQVADGQLDEAQIEEVMDQIQDLRSTDLQHNEDHAHEVEALASRDLSSTYSPGAAAEAEHSVYNPFADHMPEVTKAKAAAATVSPVTADGMIDPSQVQPDAYGNPHRQSQQIDLSGMPTHAAQKMVAMQNQLEKAKRALAAATKGKGTKQGASLYKNLAERRRAIYMTSRGQPTVDGADACLRSYVIMTCKSAPAVLAEGDMGSNLVHGGVRLSKVACAGTLQKKGGMRHNWSVRWFLFDLRNQKVAYFADSSLKKLHGAFAMHEVLSCLTPPDLAPGTEPDKVAMHRKKFLVVTPKRTWQLMAPTEEAKDLWISVFTSIISEDSKAREHHDHIAQMHS